MNNKSQYTGGNITNRKCWACHGTLNTNGFANESNQPAGSHNDTMYKNPRKCPDCHNNIQSASNFSAPQVVEHRIGAPDVPTTGTQCSLCHNNSLTAITEADGFGLSSGGNAQNATASHYLKDANANLMTTTIHSNNCTWCHITNTGNASWGTPVNPNTNFSGLHNGKLNSDCKTCHGNFNSSTIKLHDADITGGSSGGQDCVSCHETNNYPVDVNNMNKSDSIHKDLNILGSSNGRTDNKMCYACHTNNSYITGSPGRVNNNSLPVSGHPGGYTTPKNCTLCHINTNANTNFSAPQVAEHYSSGNELLTKSYTNVNDSCVGCHIKNEMLKPFNDNSGTNYSNISHYGKNRSDLVISSVVNCKYCHYNTSTSFEFEYAVNKSISNHSTNYPATTPNCDLCHRQGRMHDSNLTIPALNDILCTGCHAIRQDHNNNVSCIKCHVDSSASRDKAHPIRYIGASGGYDTSNASAADCQNCHQSAGVSGFPNATKVNVTTKSRR